MPTVLNVTTKVMNTEVTKVTTPFRGGENKNHKGLDLIPKSTAETPEILAYNAGTVIQVQNYSGTTTDTKNKGMGTSVGIRHADGTITRYQHLKYNSLKVKVGDTVKKGQVIGLYGRPTNGNSTGPHLHFDISLPSKPKEPSIRGTFCRETRYYVDPTPYLTKKAAADKPAKTEKAKKTEKKVTASLLNVRAGAGKSYPVVETIRRGCVVTILEEKDGFSRIGEGKWCCSDYLA